MGPRVFFYVQHLLGIGHLRRAATLARALTNAGFHVDFVSGGESVSGLDIGNATLRQLPPAKAADAAFSSIVDAEGKPIDEAWRADRCALLLSMFRTIRPNILLIEMFPFGRRQFRFELVPLLEAARNDPGQIVIACSVRDILVEKARADRVTQAIETVRRYFSMILVHSDPSVVAFERTFPRAAEIRDRIAYTGFVVDRPKAAAGAVARENGEVLVSAGGGAVGVKLLLTAIEARPRTRYKDRPWRIVTGANMDPGDIATLRKAAGDQRGIEIETFRPDFRELLCRCAVSVSQAGYNTLLELVATGCPAVVVPFAAGGESEQTLRASLFAARGALQMITEAELEPGSLARAIDQAQAPGPLGIDLDGARTTARLLIDAWEKRRPAP